MATKQEGFASLFLVLVIGVATLLMAQNAILTGISESQMGFYFSQGGEAFNVAESCLEETIQRIRFDSNYGIGAGTIPLSTSDGTCEIDVTDPAPNQRDIVVLGSNGLGYKKIAVNITVNNSDITLNTWEERDD